MPDSRRPASTYRRPASTYRLQLTSDFGFAAAAERADYLASLGVTHVYLSPILQAVPGSRHGYDVIDHSRVSADLGGEDGFRAMVRRFRGLELGVVVDVVPNHMAIPVPESENRQLWSVLREGPESTFAHWFDIDWTSPGGTRFLLPILSRPVQDCLNDLTPDGKILRYHDHVLPLREGTENLPVRDLLAAQHYELAYWRDASTRLNWRRFFDVTTLIGIRQEDPGVFAATHQVLLRLFADGLIDGFRVDHPDGLANPASYFERLAEATDDAWVVAEKILERDEQLPGDWRCAGTTGYDALALVDGLFVDPAGAQPALRNYRAFTGSEPTTFGQVAHRAKREVAERTFSAEIARLTRLLPGATATATATATADIHQVLVELLAAFEVYRAYVHPGEPPPDQARQAVEAATEGARRQLPDRLHATLDAVSAAVLVAGSGSSPELVVRFQQTTGPVLAKGVEDTACYRWSRLVSLNEVGGDPDRFGVPPETFHAAASQRATRWPHTMTTLSTHDTKRQEDVRARLATLAERPDEWASEVADWHRLAGGGGRGVDVVDAETEYLIWQTLVGAWPISHDRLDGYLTKAVREAKTHTSWADPDHEYEAGVLDFARRAPLDSIAKFVERIAPDARVNTLGAKLVQLTMPGVPDVYQGCELTSYALVDPDNRREVDFGRPRTDLDTEKLQVTTSALTLRRRHQEWFTGSYTMLTAVGSAADHVIAFARAMAAITIATRLPGGLRRRGGWADTVLPLPGAAWRDVLTDTRYHGTSLKLAELTQRYPVALLVPETTAQ